LIWYSITTAIMAFQTSGFGVDLWRFIAGIGIGGRAYAFNQFFQFLAVPIVAFLAWLLIPYAPFGLDGWRWVVLIGSGGAIVIWFIRLALPEFAALAGAAGPSCRCRARHRRDRTAGRSRSPGEPAATGSAAGLRKRPRHGMV
jgi:MFS transporter, putative metabolite:H+ symporter